MGQSFGLYILDLLDMAPGKIKGIESLLSCWQMDADRDEKSLVIPDGCRDLIYKSSPGKRPVWFLSDLEDSSYQVPVAKGDVFRGYRLRPGANIQSEQLLWSLNGPEGKGALPHELTAGDLASRLESFTELKRELDQALNCLASDVSSIAQVANLLGVSVRTLHRYIWQGTGRPPLFWLRLARVRKAGRAVTSSCSLAESLAEIAFDHGFSDQAHMSREFRKWLLITPSALRGGGTQGVQLLERGYG